MKTKFIPIALWSIILLFMLGCAKNELLNPDTPKVVRLRLYGNSADTLEYVIDNKVLATTGGDFNTEKIVGMKKEQMEILIRKKSSGAVLQTKTITAAPFDQTISIYYDGTKAYDKQILLQIKGYALSGELEFAVDEKIIGTGTGVISKENIGILIDENTTKVIEVRKKGETTVLLRKTLTAASPNQTLTFFFDGTSIIDNIKLTPPSNPANMSITGQFSSLFQIQSNGAIFKGGEVDLVFYIRDNAGVVTVPNPAIRITMPSSGAFVTFELPPLPNANSFYVYDICEVGTDALPYKDFAIPALYPPKINQGRFYGEIKFGTSHFEAGASKLLLLQDATSIKASPATIKGRYFFSKVTDLSEYFQ